MDRFGMANIVRFIRREITTVACELGVFPSEKDIPDFDVGLSYRVADEFHLYIGENHDPPKWVFEVARDVLVEMRREWRQINASNN